MSPELKKNLLNSIEKMKTVQHSWEKRKGSVCGKDGEKILEYSPRLPFSFFNAQLFFTTFETPNSLIVLSMVVKRKWVKI